MSPGQSALERRKALLISRIARQRSQLEWELGAFRRPLRAFELARRLGVAIRRNPKLSATVAVCAGLILMRSGLFSKTLKTVQLASSITRWWVIGQLGWQLVRRWQAPPQPEATAV
jgi:hypothetical protein